MIKVGDRVTFGAYGYFDEEAVYTVVDVKRGMFCKEYVLENPSTGHTFTAFEDEVHLVN